MKKGFLILKGLDTSTFENLYLWEFNLKTSRVKLVYANPYLTMLISIPRIKAAQTCSDYNEIVEAFVRQALFVINGSRCHAQSRSSAAHLAVIIIRWLTEILSITFAKWSESKVIVTATHKLAIMTR